MNISFLEKNGEEDKLILIFPGWSCGKEFHDKLQINGWHTAIVENYEDSGLDISVLEHYSTIYLFAWYSFRSSRRQYSKKAYSMVFVALATPMRSQKLRMALGV